jgi:signal transduction histidine kinase
LKPGDGATVDARSPLADQVFAGAGEMAGLIRATDWSRTALGPIEAWPQSLRTAVSICLGSRHPIVLWWGPERWMFYNDGYRPMLGESKHPQFLGRPGQECWAEVWDIIGPMMEQVIETGEATWSEDLILLMLRYGYLEETYFTFSYSPIRDEVGKPCGIFNACTETTGRVLGDRRMKTLRQMAVEARTVRDAARLCADVLASNPKDVPFALLYLLDEAGRELVLAGHARLPAGTPASPARVDVADDGAAWPLASVATERTARIVDDLRRFDCLPTEPWDEAPHQAMLLPIARAGGQRPAGVLVLGISPRRAFDDDYRGFFDLVASHVGTVVSNARAYEEQRGRAEKLAEVDRAKTAFFANVSHEFRTPLTLIIGPVEDALGDGGGTLQGASLEAVHRNAVRLMRLVNSLLDFSRIEAGRLQSSFEATDLPVLTGGLAGSFQSLVESAGMKLVVDCPPLAEPVWVDRSQWEKIVLNLVSNAFKFTFEGQIAVRLRRRDDHVELAVSDTGTGIPEHELPRVFERFHRVEGSRSRSFEGTGIGLALVSELVKAHGGRVRVESVLGGGSTFIVDIPVGRDHLPKERVMPSKDGALGVLSQNPVTLEARKWLTSSAAAPQVDGAAEPAQHPSTADLRHRILVADDNADMREYLLRLLQPHWDVVAVEDGMAALASALARPPHLVLSDVMMPRIDGVALLKALRADARTRSIPVVLLSARAGEEAVLQGLETGADDYLVKPFSARELLTRVRTHLTMASVRQAAADAALELAETRALLLEDVARKNRELESFSYSVSHDLRAPLRSIDGFARALIEDHAANLGPQGLDYLGRVRAAAQRMAQLIDDLLNLSRVEQADLVRRHVDLSKIAGRVADLLKRNDPDCAGEFKIRQGITAHADARLMEIVLENLLGNAWKFARKAERPQIEFDSTEREGVTSFFVRDNGAGFDPGNAARMFTPFQRFHSEKDFPGTGIGLATVGRIVDRHGGRIWAESAVGKGATFYWTVSPESRPRSP